jgi:hypothetical protein
MFIKSVDYVFNNQIWALVTSFRSGVEKFRIFNHKYKRELHNIFYKKYNIYSLRY